MAVISCNICDTLLNPNLPDPPGTSKTAPLTISKQHPQGQPSSIHPDKSERDGKHLGCSHLKTAARARLVILVL